jgi:hypothetical protein
MKKIISIVLALLMVLTLGVSFIACDNTETPADTTAGADDTTKGNDSTTAADDTTAAPDDDETTKAPDDATKAPDDETTAAPETKELHIATAEDLIALNVATADAEDYAGYTIIFDADIDLGGIEWTPMSGASFMDTIFDGKGHTISNFTIGQNNGSSHNLGFVGQTYGGVLTFNNLNFKNVTMSTSGKECGIVIGQNSGTLVDFNNCTVSDCRIDGFYDYATDKDKIAFRLAAFIGCNRDAGLATFTKCTVKDFESSGFHNLAAFVGYDAVSITECIDCVVENCRFMFSYTTGASYTLWQEKKYVAVFYNYGEWEDQLDTCKSGGNTYTNVVFVEAFTNAELDPESFRTGITEAPQA